MQQTTRSAERAAFSLARLAFGALSCSAPRSAPRTSPWRGPHSRARPRPCREPQRPTRAGRPSRRPLLAHFFVLFWRFAGTIPQARPLTIDPVCLRLPFCNSPNRTHCIEACLLSRHSDIRALPERRTAREGSVDAERDAREKKVNNCDIENKAKIWGSCVIILSRHHASLVGGFLIFASEFTMIIVTGGRVWWPR